MFSSWRYVTILSLFVVFCSVVFFGFQSERYLLVSYAILIGSMLPFFIAFERKKMEAKEIAIIAILTSLAVVGRVIFAAIPSVKPTSFVILMTGMVFGHQVGFLVGALGAFASNIFFGQGPWTPWQMFAWGSMGFASGVFGNTRIMKRLPLRILFGFLWGFFFGWIMDIWFVLGFIRPITCQTLLGGFLSSFYFDLVHAMTNAFLLALFSKSWLQVFERIKQKYDIRIQGS